MVAHLVGSIVIRPPHAMKMVDSTRSSPPTQPSAFLTLSVCGKAMIPVAGGWSSPQAWPLGLAGEPRSHRGREGGLEAMVRSAAATYAKRGLRINAVAPSLTETRLAEPAALRGCPCGV